MRTSRGRGVRGRVERMERTGSGEQRQDGDAVRKDAAQGPQGPALPPGRSELPSGRSAREPRSGAGAGPLASFAYTAADEEKQRGVRRMKLTATGLLLLVALIYVLATWAKNSGVGAGRATSQRLPRRAWWARWRTGSR
ncbi:hypothetical protein GA0115280_10407 [Streptomyces sp. Cmuel-A718b]|nr:hypothetical protein GA0115280_10407 [Streptomyces sp. Cmuel-A718b]